MKSFLSLKSFGLVSLILLLIVSSAAAAQFQADVVESRDVAIRKGHIWFKGGVYRLQMHHPGDPEHYILVNPPAHKTWLVFPKYKAYAETSDDDVMVLMNEDPFQAAELNARRYQVKVEGRESLQGQDCERQIALMQDQGIMRRWMAPELGFPVKIELLLQDDWYTVLEHIERTPIRESDLQIPAGYARKTLEALAKIFEADPEAMAKKNAYQKNRPHKSDYSDFLNSGETWNLVLSPGTKIRLEAKPMGSSQSVSWYAVPYRDQTPLNSKDQCTHQGRGKVKFDPGLGIDTLDMGVTEGRLSLKVVLIGRKPHIQAMHKVFIRNERSGSNWGIHGAYQFYRVRITSLDNREAGVRFKAAGKTHQVKLPAGALREFTFRPQDKVGDLDLMVDYGKVEVQCTQENRSEEALHAACLTDKRAPWCYQEKVVAMQNPELCGNITRYWGAKARGVEGYCYYEIARKTSDCSLCKKIKDRQMRRNLCDRDVCRKKAGRPSGPAKAGKQ